MTGLNSHQTYLFSPSPCLPISLSAYPRKMLILSSFRICIPSTQLFVFNTIDPRIGGLFWRAFAFARGAQSMDPDILIIDDEVDIIHFMRRALMRAGYRVRTAADGAAALT